MTHHFNTYTIPSPAAFGLFPLHVFDLELADDELEVEAPVSAIIPQAGVVLLGDVNLWASTPAARAALADRIVINGYALDEVARQAILDDPEGWLEDEDDFCDAPEDDDRVSAAVVSLWSELTQEDEEPLSDNDDPQACPFCGTHWLFGDADGYPWIYGCDVHFGGDVNGAPERFLTWHPCCQAVSEAVQWHGFEFVYGVTVEQAASTILGEEVVEVAGEIDAEVVCRLVVKDPAEKTILKSGAVKAVSPKGWRDEVFEDVTKHHRHLSAPTGHKFSVAVYNGGIKVGVAVVSRPVSRRFAEQHPEALEVTRVATWGHKELRRNASSKLYAAACKKARQLGARLVITYTLAEETGHSLEASGFTATHQTKGETWSRPSRARTTVTPGCKKIRWEKGLTKSARKDVARRGQDFAAKLVASAA